MVAVRGSLPDICPEIVHAFLSHPFLTEFIAAEQF